MCGHDQLPLCAEPDSGDAVAHVREVFEGFSVAVVDNAPGALPVADPAVRAFVEVVGRSHPKFGWTDVARFSSLGIPALNFDQVIRRQPTLRQSSCQSQIFTNVKMTRGAGWRLATDQLVTAA